MTETDLKMGAAMGLPEIAVRWHSVLSERESLDRKAHRDG